MVATLEDLQIAQRVIEDISVMAWHHDAARICGAVQVVHGCIVTAIAKKLTEVHEHDANTNQEIPPADHTRIAADGGSAL